MYLSREIQLNIQIQDRQGQPDYIILTNILLRHLLERIQK